MVLGQTAQQHESFDLRFGIIFRKIGCLLGRFHRRRMIAARQCLKFCNQQIGLRQLGVDFQCLFQIT